MKTNSIIISGVLSGLTFAAFMVVFSYLNNEDFSLWKFIFHAAFFGTFMGFMVRYNQKKNKHE